MSKKKKFAVGVAVILVGLVVFKDPLIAAIKPSVNRFMMTFPESEFRDEEINGSYANVACQNSHSNWGEQVRRTQSLDGIWQVEQGALDDQAPAHFTHTAPVPGLLTEAEPRFEQVGLESDEREAFWYRKTFTAPTESSAQALLCLHKAKYGTKVWLNGQLLGEHYGAYSVSEYNLSKAIRYGRDNELIVRLGAEHKALPEFVPIGADFEKYGWYPGLWDSVSVVYTGDISIVRTKIEADIDRGMAIARTTVRNNRKAPVRLSITQQVREWQNQQVASETISKAVMLEAGETQTVSQEVPLHLQRLWSPEDPFLYTAHSAVAYQGSVTDDRVTRFGMRKVVWKGGDEKGFYLNNQRYYLRGTNIALHRFFEDQDRKQLPWQEEWVRELLSGHMKDFHWNSLRFHVGRAPNFWYDLADEIGLVVTDEFHLFAPVWTGIPGMPSSVNWSLRELEKEFTAWIQENWNHPSIGWWDASNENHNPLPYETVPLVRHLDSTRAWESGSYRAPHLPDDPLEEHPYKLNGTGFMNSNPREYVLADLDNFSRLPPMTSGIIFRTYDGEEARYHPYINNEYGWLWLTRDGSDATPIAETAFELMAPGVNLTPEERREIYAYVVSELSGYWRARRGYAGVQHFLYLGKCTDKDTIPDTWDIKEASATCDNFIDVPSLTMEPRWAQWAPHGFAPVGVNLDLWSEDSYQPGTLTTVPVSLINDTPESRNVELQLWVADKEGRILSRNQSQPITLGPLEARQLSPQLQLPDQDQFVVYAVLYGEVIANPVISRRKRGFAHPGVNTQLPQELNQRLTTSKEAP